MKNQNKFCNKKIKILMLFKKEINHFKKLNKVKISLKLTKI